MHLCVNEREVLPCSLNGDATEIRWQKDGQPYNDGILQQTSSSSIAQVVASPGLNGSRFDCLASFGGADELEVIDSWIIVVHESKKEGSIMLVKQPCSGFSSFRTGPMTNNLKQ